MFDEMSDDVSSAFEVHQMALVGVAPGQRATPETVGQIGGQTESVESSIVHLSSLAGLILQEMLKMFGKNMKLGI